MLKAVNPCDKWWVVAGRGSNITWWEQRHLVVVMVVVEGGLVGGVSFVFW